MEDMKLRFCGRHGEVVAKRNVKGIGNEGRRAKTMESTTLREFRKHDFHKLQ